MNVLGEDREKISIGLVLGLTAVTVGVGVGVGFGVSAALYYFYKKSSTDPEPRTIREQIRTVEHDTHDCPICFEDMLKGRRDIRKLKCGHNFHEACIRPWLVWHNTCPYCRKNIYRDNV